MAERRENSVLFSLKELRRIEDDRVKKEQEEAQARLEAEKQAKEAAVRAARDDEERRKREEEDRVRRIEEDKEHKVREEQYRLQEAERRARVEGELKLQEERMRLEVQARSGHKSPVKAIAGVTVVLVLVAVGLGFRMYSSHQAELQIAQARNEELERQGKLAQAEYERKMSAIQKEMEQKLATAKSEDERSRIRDEYQAQQRQAEFAKRTHRASAGNRPSGDRGDAPAAPGVRPRLGKKDVSDNPLEGL
ncbi:MAG TPA: hypothetical protein VNO55_17415 [Polyangia bacterium]|nr:hypothetical protein [Polyangia bacterium]